MEVVTAQCQGTRCGAAVLCACLSYQLINTVLNVKCLLFSSDCQSVTQHSKHVHFAVQFFLFALLTVSNSSRGPTHL